MGRSSTLKICSPFSAVRPPFSAAFPPLSAVLCRFSAVLPPFLAENRRKTGVSAA